MSMGVLAFPCSFNERHLKQWKEMRVCSMLVNSLFVYEAVCCNGRKCSLYYSLLTWVVTKLLLAFTNLCTNKHNHTYNSIEAC